MHYYQVGNGPRATQVASWIGFNRAGYRPKWSIVTDTDYNLKFLEFTGIYVLEFVVKICFMESRTD